MVPVPDTSRPTRTPAGYQRTRRARTGRTAPDDRRRSPERRFSGQAGATRALASTRGSKQRQHRALLATTGRRRTTTGRRVLRCMTALGRTAERQPCRYTSAEHRLPVPSSGSGTGPTIAPLAATGLPGHIDAMPRVGRLPFRGKDKFPSVAARWPRNQPTAAADHLGPPPLPTISAHRRCRPSRPTAAAGHLGSQPGQRLGPVNQPTAEPGYRGFPGRDALSPGRGRCRPSSPRPRSGSGRRRPRQPTARPSWPWRSRGSPR